MAEEPKATAVKALSEIMQSNLSKNPALADKQRRLLEALRQDPNLLQCLDAAKDAVGSDVPSTAPPEGPSDDAATEPPTETVIAKSKPSEAIKMFTEVMSARRSGRA